MQKKNKIVIQTIPVRSPSPDIRNRNKIANTSIETSTIKSYLQSIKNRGQKEKDSSIQQPLQYQLQLFSSQKSQLNPYIDSNYEILRKRIIQLEIQNNQFRQMVKDVEQLSNKNRQLQEKMLMILSELEYSDSEVKTHNRFSTKSNLKTQKAEYSTKENICTEQSKGQTIKYEFQTKQFQNEQFVDMHQKDQPFANLKIQRSRNIEKETMQSQKQILKQFDFQARTLMTSFQSIFTKLFKLFDIQLKEMKTYNQQLQKMPLLLSSSSEGELGAPKQSYNNLSYKITKPFNRDDLCGQKTIQNVSQFYKLSEKQRKNSLVDINLQNVSDSQSSLSQLNKKDLVKQASKKQFIERPSIKDFSILPPLKCKEDQPYNIMQKVLQSIEIIKNNLIFIQSQQYRIKQTKLVQFQSKVFQKLQDILTTFFSHKKMHTSSFLCQENFRQSLVLRQKFKITHSGKLQHTNNKDHNDGPSLLNNIEEARICNYQQIPTTPVLYSVQFQETKRKLQEIIELMRSINQEYHKSLQNHKEQHKDKPFYI